MFKVEEIKDPSFIKQLNNKELEALATDIREFIIKNVAATGGHLASNLGVVEITLAMHYVFDSPKDKFIFDVGHQAYVHKILTGRANKFPTLRQVDGLSGYISRDESEHDIWESGHSSTSISAQSGLIAAMYNNQEDGRVISLIGDSSIANGVAFEGLNFLGQDQSKQPIIILNDNKMGINRSVGAMTKLLNRIRGSKGFRAMRGASMKILPNFIINFLHKIKRGIKGFVQRDNIFEDLGFDYYGPYEGNNVGGLIKILKRAKQSSTPCIIHIVTRKGQGYKPAEENMTDFHGVDGFVPTTGEITKSKEGISYTELISNELLKLRENNQFSLICPAMISSAKLSTFKEKYPNDCYDVGIAEEHATVMAAGMAIGKQKAVVMMYSTFAQRAFDHILNDVCRSNLDVVFLFDRAGVVGRDGSTHQGIYDLAMLNLMPNIKIMMGRNAGETKGLLDYAITQKGPIALRYPKNITIDAEKISIFDESWEYILRGNKGFVISYGPDLLRIENIVKENKLDISIINARFVRPLDKSLLDEIAKTNLPIVIYEQVVETASLGMMINSYFNKKSYNTLNIHTMSFDKDEIVRHGEINDVLIRHNLGDDDILKKIKEVCKD